MSSRRTTRLLVLLLWAGLFSLAALGLRESYPNLLARPGDQPSPNLPAQAPTAPPSPAPDTRTPGAASFSFQPHADLQGMSVVHFLAWDIADGRKVTVSLEVVVAEGVAAEVAEIFGQIYSDDECFPIHDVVGYNYRSIAGGRGLSKHACGRAIDLNRAENPMLKAGRKIVHPEEPAYTPGEWRPGEDPYSMARDGSVVRIFKAHGWRWGGDWTSCKDYQHFDKPARTR